MTAFNMAAPLSTAISVNKLAISTCLRGSLPIVQQCCGFRTKYKKGQPRNPIGVKGKYRRAYVVDGEFVYKGDTILKQFGLVNYPGENVGILKNNTLVAARDGIVMCTTENLNPYPDSPLYERVKNGMVIERQFWHVYPTPVHAKFKLISELVDNESLKK